MPAGSYPPERRRTPNPDCPECGTHRMRRLPREGFWQRSFWPLFGMYPWECPTCRKLRLVRRRGKRGQYGGKAKL